MAIRTQRIAQGLWRSLTAPDRGRLRAGPARIVLPPLTSRDEVKPPVRLFIGTQAAQFRAERVLLWSILRTRDPARAYEVYLMKDLAGFDPLLWLTGFTNYRYAIPAFAGFAGRAIYNDVDQIYLDDPAKLFDTPMDGHGVLSINDRDTSVMLIDCARMAATWTLEAAQRRGHRALEARLRAEPGLWGPLDGTWNARDEEYQPGRSRLIHYTTIHAQPWRPQPRDYVYRQNPAGEVWFELERVADAAGFTVFDATRPSPDFPAKWLPADPPADDPAASSEPWQSLAAYLAQLPDWDVPWVLDRLLRAAPAQLAVTVDLTHPPRQAPADPEWWYAQLAAAGARQPAARWHLTVRRRGLAGRVRRDFWSGGPPLSQPPRTWALLYRKAGHRSQALGLAEALGWPFETREVGEIRRYLGTLLGADGPLAPARLPGGIEPPWPDVIIASGWLPAIVARWIARRNQGRTRLVLLGRKAGPLGESQDIAIGCRHFRLPPEPRRIDTVLPISKVNHQRLAEAARRWPQLFDGQARPRVVLLVGGSCTQYRLDPDTAARLVEQVEAATRAAGGSLAVVTSPRTGRAATAAIVAAAGPDTRLDAYVPRLEANNPFLGYLAGADILVVTGESESMLAEAVATGKPVYIYPLPPRRPGLPQRLGQAVYHAALRDRTNARGTPRPQQGLQYLCARALERRWLVPPRDMPMLHQGLIELGVARFFEASVEVWQPQPWQEIEAAAEQIRRLLGVPAGPGPAAISKAA